MKSATVYLYAEPSAIHLDMDRLDQYLSSHLPSLSVMQRDEFISFHLSQLAHDHREEAINQLAESLAYAKVRDPLQQRQDVTPLYGEIAYEKRRLASSRGQTFGLLYDGFRVMQLYSTFISPSERSQSHIHIIFTNQLLGTWEEDDRRYHARVNILGFPNLISTTGVVEAPARPREYYFLKQQYAQLGMDDAPSVFEEQFKGRFIKHEDPHLTDVMKGYIMQAIFYQFLGEGFCEDRNCRLFNAHWQQEVILAQLNSPYEFCSRHEVHLRQMGLQG